MVMKPIRALIALAAIMAALAGPGMAAAGDRQDAAVQLQEALRRIGTNYVIDCADSVGQFILEAQGDKGGYAKLHLQFNGFYLRPVLTLSQSKQGVIPESDEYQDVYEFLPKSMAVLSAMSVTRRCVSPQSEIFSNFTGSFSGLLAHDAPPNYESTDMSIRNWMYQNASVFLKDRLRFSFRVVSRQPAGGKAREEPVG